MDATWAWTSQAEPSSVEECPLTTTIRDAVEGYYENIVDEILSTNSETFLLDLTHMRSIQSGRLRSVASQLNLENLNDACLLEMPAIIAKNVQQLNEQVYDSVNVLLDRYLPLLLPRYVSKLDNIRLNELLLSLNKVVVYELNETIENYKLTSRITQEMNACQTSARTAVKFTSQLHQWFVFSGPNSVAPTGQGAIDKFLQITRLGLASALRARIEDLQNLISQELQDEYDS
ncbi:hypothetical protein EC973_005442 [Apophysomyces ossiformis]|uniref:Uncharacterized protein n=1 Tax=Apophysomyces ossiformis TaxID=679940 RepID=A0A8H7EUS6_9FUNG|nr:hypothetical protein EC973_005442 [Apophysomyces ossiformis]